MSLYGNLIDTPGTGDTAPGPGPQGAAHTTLPSRSYLNFEAGTWSAPVPDEDESSSAGRIWAEYARVGGGSTAWIELTRAVEDNTVYDGPEVPLAGPVPVDWDQAWEQYQLAVQELPPSDRVMADAYNLDEMSGCAWCSTRDVDHNLVEVEWSNKSEPERLYYHESCLAELLRERGL